MDIPMDVLQELIGEIPGNPVCRRVLAEAYGILFEDAASVATHKTKNVIRQVLPQFADRFDSIAVGADGTPLVTHGTGSQQTNLEYLEHEIRNRFFHSGANIKFEPGVARIAYGELDMHIQSHSPRLDELDGIIKLISEGHAQEYDCDLNGLTFDELSSRFGTAYREMTEEMHRRLSEKEYAPSRYIIEEIPDFETARKYSEYTDYSKQEHWCITHMRRMWESYTESGVNKVYFCHVPDFENVPHREGPNCPLDEYGLSLISIIVSPFSQLRSVTCRWNHEHGGSDGVMDAEKVSDVLGGNVFELCPPPKPPERHIERVGEDAVRIGGQVWMCRNLSAEPDERNGIFRNPDTGETYFTWEAAKREAGKHPGWHLPNRKDWDDLVDFCGGREKAGMHLKSTDGWQRSANANNGFDTYGFDARPVGWMSETWGVREPIREYKGAGMAVAYWTSAWANSLNQGKFAFTRDFLGGNFVYDFDHDVNAALPVRLVRDT